MIVPILVLHYFDMKSTPKSYDVDHKTCVRSVDFAEEIKHLEYKEKNPDLGAALGNFLGELLMAGTTQHDAAK
jgi:hypothetical protein